MTSFKIASFWFGTVLLASLLMLVSVGSQCYSKGFHAKVPKEEDRLIRIAVLCMPIPVVNICMAARYLVYIS